MTGTSAGAVNATAIAVHADRFRVAVGNLERVWRNFQVGQVFRADTGSMHALQLALAARDAVRRLAAAAAESLFDNSPLRELLRSQFDFAGIRRSIDAGHLDALAMSAAGYIERALGVVLRSASRAASPGAARAARASRRRCRSIT